MHGQLVELFVTPEDSVTAGQKLAVVEAMKMFHEITAPADGTVEEVFAEAGSQVAADQLLVQIALDDEAERSSTHGHVTHVVTIDDVTDLVDAQRSTA